MASPFHGSKATPAAPASGVPSNDLSGLFGDRIAQRNPGLPAGVVANSAEAYVALHERLAGCASNLGGGRSGALWRDLTAAERGLTLEWLFYLASLPMAEPREAVRAVVAELARAVEPKTATGTLLSRAAEAVLSAAQLNRIVQQALADDALTVEERREVLQAVAEARRELDGIEALAVIGGAR
jgi:hypothetical protein